MSELEFQTFLRRALKSRGWSVLRLASETGISDAVIYRWLRPVAPKRPSDANLKKLAPVLGVSEQELLEMTGYLAREGKPPERDPVLAVVNAAWPRLEEWRRKAIGALAEIGAGVLIDAYLPLPATGAAA